MSETSAASVTDVYDELRPMLDELEAFRRSALRSFCVVLLVTVLVTPFLVRVLIELESLMPEKVEYTAGSLPAFGLMAWLLIMALVIRSKVIAHRRRYTRRYKEAVFGIVCARLFPMIRYKPGEGVSYREFDGTQLFPYESETYYSEDRLEGIQGKTDIQLAEVTARRKKLKWDSDGLGTRNVVFFRGLFMIADFHKHFHSKIRILPEGERNRSLRKEQLIQMEDPEFEAEFVVFGTDQIDARYVLSSSMLRRILDIKRRWRNDTRLAFKESRVYLTIQHSRNWFEPSLYRSARNYAQIEEFVDELDFCLGLVSDLNLNTRIWSKR